MREADPSVVQPAVEVASPDDLVSTLEAVRRAVEAGELDAQIEAASGALRLGSRR